MSIPNYKGKYSSKPVFSPDDLREYRDNTSGGETYKPPENIIMCYSPALIEYVKNNHKVKREQFTNGELYSLDETGGKVGIIGNFGFGAPVAVTMMEVFIALGVKRFMNIGLAGALQKHADIGNIVVCDSAIRDEGTSYHYLEPAVYAYPDQNLTERTKRVLEKQGFQYHVGPTWTIDAPYRETEAEVLKYQEDGILTVDMEASALFAVAEFRGVQMGAIFTVSDSLADLEWLPHFHSEKTARGLENIFKVSLEVLSD